ncbi:MAG: hypothetical protein AAFR66_19145 [Bacteroidota bacterium]
MLKIILLSVFASAMTYLSVYQMWPDLRFKSIQFRLGLFLNFLGVLICSQGIILLFEATAEHYGLWGGAFLISGLSIFALCIWMGLRDKFQQKTINQ